MILVGAANSEPCAAQSNGAATSEAALVKLDLEQKDMVSKADFARLAALAAPGLTINAPTNRVLSRSNADTRTFTSGIAVPGDGSRGMRTVATK
jgi:hypothetical protein